MTPWMRARRILGLEGPKIVTVGLIAGNKILTGQRRDNNKWTNPGGHMDQGESLIEAACREALEESGIKLDPTELELISAERITSEKTGKPFSVFAFLAHIPQKRATNKNDPDEEISQWKWVELSQESPELHPANRHAQHDNVLCYLGHCRSHGRLSKKQTEFTGRRLQMTSDDYTEGISGVSREIQQGQQSEGQAIDNISRKG